MIRFTKGFNAIAFSCLLFLFLTAESCRNGGSEADRVQEEQVQALASEAQRQTGMPGISNFTEKKFAKYLYELRDQVGFSTFTYIVDFNGQLHFVCESIGYGIPYSVQYVNPEYSADRWQGNWLTLPQAEPNGLFMPEGLSATWILCTDGSGDIKPIYSEPELLVSPFELNAASSYIAQR
jgi:hypothetical protein